MISSISSMGCFGNLSQTKLSNIFIQKKPSRTSAISLKRWTKKVKCNRDKCKKNEKNQWDKYNQENLVLTAFEVTLSRELLSESSV